jgi:hypothetical protein
MRPEKIKARLLVTHRPGFGSAHVLSARANANRAFRLAASAQNSTEKKSYVELGAAWAALADSKDWLEGKRPPIETRQASFLEIGIMNSRAFMAAERPPFDAPSV